MKVELLPRLWTVPAKCKSMRALGFLCTVPATSNSLPMPPIVPSVCRQRRHQMRPPLGEAPFRHVPAEPADDDGHDDARIPAMGTLGYKQPTSYYLDKWLALLTRSTPFDKGVSPLRPARVLGTGLSGVRRAAPFFCQQGRALRRGRNMMTFALFAFTDIDFAPFRACRAVRLLGMVYKRLCGDAA